MASISLRYRFITVTGARTRPATIASVRSSPEASTDALKRTAPVLPSSSKLPNGNPPLRRVSSTAAASAVSAGTGDGASAYTIAPGRSSRA